MLGFFEQSVRFKYFPVFLDIYWELSLVPRIALMTTLQGANDPSQVWPIRRPECCNLDQWEAWTGDSDTRRYQACNAARQPLTYEQLITKQNGLARGESWQYWSKILCDLVPSLWFPASKGFKFDLVWIYWVLWSPNTIVYYWIRYHRCLDFEEADTRTRQLARSFVQRKLII